MTTAHFSTFNSTIVRLINQQVLLAQRAMMRLASTLAPRFAVKQAMDRFMTPPRFPQPEAEHALLANAAAMDLVMPLGSIRAWRFGERAAPVILFSHGWGGRGAQFRSFVPALLDAGYQVILFDHIGHGQSTGRKSSLVDFWRGLEAVLRALDAQGFMIAGLVGHSLGSAAIASALRSMPLASGLRTVLIAPPASVIRYSKFFARYLGISERIRDAMQWRFEQRTGVAWHEFELPHSVDRIATKALIVHDRDDRDVGIDSGLAIARAWPDARFRETRRLGHNRILRDRDVIQNVVDFLADRVEFMRPPAAGERSPFERNYNEPAPLY